MAIVHAWFEKHILDLVIDVGDSELKEQWEESSMTSEDALLVQVFAWLTISKVVGELIMGA